MAGHDVNHTSRVGLSAASNGELLKAAAEQGFDLLMTVDQKIRHEHNLENLPISILELDTRDSRLPALQALAVHFEKAIAATLTHRFVSLDQNGTITGLAERTH